MESYTILNISPATWVIMVINSIIILALLYLLAYRPIMRKIGKSSQKDSKDTGYSSEEQLIQSKQKMDSYISKAIKHRQQITERAKQATEEIKQKAQGEDRKTLEAIIKEARSELSQELNSAIHKVHQEYDNLVVQAKGNDIIHLDEKTNDALPHP